ncbi:MAG: SurA N-terminal domain-containing protein [Deltaproteobacteria bacterium]|jgi:peptidyl-prolyl cis-trans isomerase SurA|nr:SurA N-terminal domain-containing protein [Deltaproteobacteria bacterium]
MSKKPLFLTLVLVFSILCLSGQAFSATKVDRIVAQVNRNVITLSELEARMALLSPAQKAALSAGGQSAESMVLNMMIDEELINQTATRYDIRVSDAEINDAINTIMTENKINEAQLRESLQRGGMTLQAFRLQLRQEILTNKLIGLTVVNRLVVTESEVTDFLNGKLPSDIDPVLSASGVSNFDGVRMIYLDCSPRTAQAVMTKAASIKREIEEGLPFEEAARKYSQGPGRDQGGNADNLTVMELAPELQAIAKKLVPGTVSEPLYGGQVVLLITVIPSQKPADSQSGKGSVQDFTPEQRQSARRQLEQMKVRSKLETFMETLKRTAVIKVTL